MESLDNVSKVDSCDDSLTIESGSTKDIDGEILNVNGAEIISVKDYYGSEVSDITGDDIHSISDSAASLYCREAMKVGNRVSLELTSGKSVEINGRITGCYIKE